ncbi:MAG: hypothetical protein DLM65_09310 [Candidatus Aeolococcus gillhamiae]|uniref:Uncharacterized protein n=1 Tax=Candidatus Aeolococcus gillhamiae TaxID=3127015 RepID=A0A2W6AQC4_9BACT|nr:MAG: hypothetical protein DLM65_09310 [Candidatus Dormibacter sp. RRmetagenome_bin12]
MASQRDLGVTLPLWQGEGRTTAIGIAGLRPRGRLMTLLRTAHQQGADAVALLIDLARAPDPGVVAGLILRSS